jgi:hypothetical protein
VRDCIRTKEIVQYDFGKGVFRMDRIEQEVFGEEADDLSSY